MTESDDDSIPQNCERFTIDDRSPTLAVVDSVASFKDTDPLDLPPFAYDIDPEALDQFTSDTTGGTVRFRYAGVDVEVTSSGMITVAERTVELR